jgi:hypothetical protein
MDEHILGWYGLLLPVLLEIERYNKENKDNEISVSANEKLGGLDIRLSNRTTYIHEMAVRAERESYKICQLCGAEGKLISIRGWYWTLCDYHVEVIKRIEYSDEKRRRLYIKNFMKPIGEINKKKCLCKECYNYKQTLQQNDNLRFCWIKECTTFDCLLSAAKKKCQGTYINKIYTAKRDMKVVKMINWEDAQDYPQCEDQNNYKDFWDCVKKFLVDKNIKYNGSWHQNWEYGTPLVDFGGKIYAFATSMRRWGKLMADAFEPDNKDPLAYVDWAFQVPDGEQFTVDENKDPLLGSESITGEEGDK